ncbi:HAD-IA family hydrolase [Sphingobium ummariense]
MTAVLHRGGFAAFLFDMDGTILDSIAVANRIWTRWAERHGLDAAEILRVMHGVQAVQTVRRFAPAGINVEEEAAAITEAEVAETAGVVAIPGAAPFLQGLPPERWAVVTSAPRRLALRRLWAAGLPVPAVLVCAEDVTNGKPAPDCFLAAARALGVPISDCLIWEDAPAGIAAAEAAGATVIVVGATHPRRLETPHPVVQDYVSFHVEADSTGALTLVALGQEGKRP